MSTFFSELLGTYGYFGMFLAMILEAVIIIIPSELILATSGILASRGIFSFLGAFLTGLFGSVFCAIFLYLMGYFGGRTFIEKYGKYFFMKQEDLERADSWFSKYGMFAAFLGRNFPIIRTFISIPIGVTKLSFPKFVFYTTLGSIPWTYAFVYVGYHLGQGWTVLKDYTSKLELPIYLFLLFLVVRYLYKKIKYKNDSSSF